jgi:hypothetical protein
LGVGYLLRWIITDLAVGHALIAASLITGIAVYSIGKLIQCFLNHEETMTFAEDDDSDSDNPQSSILSVSRTYGGKKKKHRKKKAPQS